MLEQRSDQDERTICLQYIATIRSVLVRLDRLISTGSDALALTLSRSCGNHDIIQEFEEKDSRV
jgi:hypothetical protein